MTSKLSRGVFVLSLDFELVWGSRDLVDDPTRLEAEAELTRSQVFEPMLAMIRELDICSTWATVGHLFLDGLEDTAHPDIVRPDHSWHPQDWFTEVPPGNESTAPAWYGRSLIEALRDAGQEVGSHSFSHPIFGDPGCSRAAADSDLRRCVAEANALGIELDSFVFPRNQAGHIDLLAAHGFTCWRPIEPTWFLSPRVPRPLGRLGHLAEVVSARTPPTVLPSIDEHGLVCIPGSATFLPAHGIRRTIPMSRRVRRSTRGLDRAVHRREVFHLYTHPINLATAPVPMLDGLRQVLHHAARLRDRGHLDIMSMGELAGRWKDST